MWLFFLLKSRWWKENRRPPKTGTPRGDAAVSEQQSAELEETLRPQRSVGFVLISTIFVQVDARPAHWVAVGKKLDTTIKKKPASPHTHTQWLTHDGAHGYHFTTTTKSLIWVSALRRENKLGLLSLQGSCVSDWTYSAVVTAFFTLLQSKWESAGTTSAWTTTPSNGSGLKKTKR